MRQRRRVPYLKRPTEYAINVPVAMTQDEEACRAYWLRVTEERGYIALDDTPRIMVLEQARIDGEYLFEDDVKKIGVLRGMVTSAHEQE